MVLLVFIGINPEGEYREQCYSDQDAESCFEGLTQLVRKGWQVVSVRYFDMFSTTAIDLPIAAFDGRPMKEFIRQLQAEWEMIITAV